jgi:hypothetical protein
MRMMFMLAYIYTHNTNNRYTHAHTHTHKYAHIIYTILNRWYSIWDMSKCVTLGILLGTVTLPIAKNIIIFFITSTDFLIEMIFRPHIEVSTCINQMLVTATRLCAVSVSMAYFLDGIDEAQMEAFFTFFSLAGFIPSAVMTIWGMVNTIVEQASSFFDFVAAMLGSKKRKVAALSVCAPLFALIWEERAKHPILQILLPKWCPFVHDPDEDENDEKDEKQRQDPVQGTPFVTADLGLVDRPGFNAASPSLSAEARKRLQASMQMKGKSMQVSDSMCGVSVCLFLCICTVYIYIYIYIYIYTHV